MAVGDIITAVRYNNIQSTIEDVLGVGSANFGYGGNTASNPNRRKNCYSK